MFWQVSKYINTRKMKDIIMKEYKKNKIEKMVNKNQEKGKYNRDFLYNFILENPGLTTYQISKILDWTYGKIKYTIKILKKENKIMEKKGIKNNRLQIQYYMKAM